MIKKHTIYKKDKWNMMNVEVHGTKIVLTEISDQWGEESYTFVGRPAMMHWAHERFPKSNFEGNEQEWEAIMNAFAEV
ncbi:hypothetical protein B5M42_009325 [Paenibacillus athensensis]|uniref:Uncharacterized protein n=1 Tax=Paenibacillus athensensis TaxID=1967502 RepID=A0A4Y8QAA2_9BACL|nr:hypothetical protein [Paenibacillus athensensis]MCD1259038.1 hypothetical protein [Paenibacillus athensensis]